MYITDLLLAGLLVEIKEILCDGSGTDISLLKEEFYATLPYKSSHKVDLHTLKAVTAQFNLIQVRSCLLLVREHSWLMGRTLVLYVTGLRFKSLNAYWFVFRRVFYL